MDLTIRGARILVVVKAYPNPSKLHRETVCTAGLLDGEHWVRIYPVPYRLLKDESQFPKYGWIKVDIERRTKDFRPESFHLLRTESDSILVDGKIPPGPSGWRERKKYVLKEVYDSMDALIARAKSPERISIGVVKPKEVQGVVGEETDREWDPETLALLQEQDLFEPNDSRLRVVKKVPYKFSYLFRTTDGKDRKMMVEDWEIGALFWHAMKLAGYNEAEAVAKVKEKLWSFATQKDLYLIMGTTQEYHLTAPNPFVIIGLFYPPFDSQLDLF